MFGWKWVDGDRQQEESVKIGKCIYVYPLKVGLIVQSM